MEYSSSVGAATWSDGCGSLFLALVLLKDDRDRPSFCSRGTQVLLCFERMGCLVCLAALHCFETFPTEDVLAASGY